VVEEQVEYGEEVLHLANSSIVLNTDLGIVSNEGELDRLDEAVQLLNACPIHQSTDDNFPAHMYSIPGLLGTEFLAHHIWAIWFIVRRLIRHAYMPGALVVDEIVLGNTFTSVAVATICKLVTEKVEKCLPLSIL
jgi:hypothetical protein